MHYAQVRHFCIFMVRRIGRLHTFLQRRLPLYLLAAAIAGNALGTVYAHSATSYPAPERHRAIECLSLAIAYEAGSESLEGQQAIAEVVLNRLHNPAFPDSVCDVIFSGSDRPTGCQFTFTCDGSMRRKIPENVLRKARAVAIQAVDGNLPRRVAGATHYHADYVRPYWAPTLVKIGKIGSHIFYRGAGRGKVVFARNHGQSAKGNASFPNSTRPSQFAPWGIRLPFSAEKDNGG